LGFLCLVKGYKDVPYPVKLVGCSTTDESNSNLGTHRLLAYPPPRPSTNLLVKALHTPSHLPSKYPTIRSSCVFVFEYHKHLLESHSYSTHSKHEKTPTVLRSTWKARPLHSQQNRGNFVLQRIIRQSSEVLKTAIHNQHLSIQNVSTPLLPNSQRSPP
jgi:hypothetical protein